MNNKKNNQNPTRQFAGKVLAIVTQLTQETHPGSININEISLDASFDQDLGLDSLTRVELMHRVENAFEVTLAEDAFAKLNTVRDLIVALSSASNQKISEIDTETIRMLDLGSNDLRPDNALTLVDVLQWHTEQHPERKHIEFYKDVGVGDSLNYQQLAAKSYQIGWGLFEHRIKAGSKVTIMLPSCCAYFYSFLGVIAAGAIAVPIYPPTRLTQIERYIERHKTILANSEAEIMITSNEVKPYATLIKSIIPGLRQVLSIEDFNNYSDSPLQLKLKADDIAFIQYTSGSTSEPKGVQLSHNNLLANIRAMGNAIDLKSSDIFVSWLPLYHDMGLIGAWLGMFYHSALLVIMSPLEFLLRPQRWLWAIHRYRATLSAAPNFAYELCLDKINDGDLKSLDLSSWRVACNGAEPVSPKVVRGFCQRFSAFGFIESAMWPVYGLAESSVGLAFPEPDKTPYVDQIERKLFITKGIAKKTQQPDALEFVACGKALPKHQMRIVDDMGFELADRQQGHLQFCGPSATRGYYRNPLETKALIKNGWLDTGDLAYMDKGVVFITGRTKDIIIRAGRNIYPHEVEEIIGNIEGIRTGRVVAFGYTDQSAGKERLVIMTEKRLSSNIAQAELEKKIITACADIIDLPPDDIVFVPANTILKTSSGKLRRQACKDLYLSGQYRHKPPALWRQISRLILIGFKQQAQRQLKNMISLLYAGYCWLVFLILALLAGILFALPASQKSRQKLASMIARLLVFFTASELNVKGLENIQATKTAILVANHSSYLDVYCLLAALPLSFRFVAKAELSKRPVIGWLLKRMGVVFVERFDPGQSIADFEKIASLTDSLLFFPEGTFTRSAGLREFHLGAFITAINNNQPVLPICISGTRDMLRAGSWFPRKAPIDILIMSPIKLEVTAEGERWILANRLKDIVRNKILEQCNEPDLE